MRSTPDRGRVYRRCGCRDQRRKQYGTRCSQLTTDPDHGSWTFAVDLPSPTHHTRHTIRRAGFPTREAARAALRRLLVRACHQIRSAWCLRCTLPDSVFMRT